MSSDWQPVANGVRTDHPIPNLPFIDDSHIPIEDPAKIEALGRHSGTNMWGRYDTDQTGHQWAAYTTDPQDHCFAWVVRFHPDHGRSVTVYRNEDGASAYQEWFRERALLTRLGGHWWDGTTWYRPRQVISYASEGYMRRKVRQATTITAEDLLDNSCKPDLGEVGKILHFDPDTGPIPMQQWRHDLAAWSVRRRERPDALPLNRCVVTLNAPELVDAVLLGVDEFAAEVGIAASTLRAYLSRDEGDLPAPQFVDGNRRRWSLPVVRDWNEQRRRDPSAVASVLTGDAESSLSPGLLGLWKRLTNNLFSQLWDQPAMRRRWSRPHRNEAAVRDVAERGAWTAALHLDQVVPFDDVAWAIERAVLHDLATGKDFALKVGYTSFNVPTERVLSWFVEYKPSRVPALFGHIVREAETKLGIPPKATKESLRRGVEIGSNSDADEKRLREFLAVVIPPDK
ncbi:hypothetical protein AB0A63_31650 [Lentzea sp. NPDC042327]|uniref:helix-turn-helix transcriptional regulator n=1 Tax=Lentzea sp. NPDC042327 TaxID=3154801 RepID=UPI0033E3E76B